MSLLPILSGQLACRARCNPHRERSSDRPSSAKVGHLALQAKSKLHLFFLDLEAASALMCQYSGRYQN